jgi:hypothetical protein
LADELRIEQERAKREEQLRKSADANVKVTNGNKITLEIKYFFKSSICYPQMQVLVQKAKLPMSFNILWICFTFNKTLNKPIFSHRSFIYMR